MLDRALFLGSLLEALPTAESDCADTCSQFFNLLLSLLKTECLQDGGSRSPGALQEPQKEAEHTGQMRQLLEHSVGWLLKVDAANVSQELLAGHLGLARVLLTLPQFSVEVKTRVGAENGLVRQLLDVFLFPAYRHIVAASCGLRLTESSRSESAASAADPNSANRLMINNRLTRPSPINAATFILLYS